MNTFKSAERPLRKENNPRFFYAYAELTNAAQNPTIKRMDKAIQAIARKLGEVEAEPLQKLEQIVKIIGIEQTHAFCDKALEIEKQGGIMTNDGLHRRTVGGIFFYLIKGSGNKDIKKLFFKPRKKSNTLLKQTSRTFSHSPLEKTNYPPCSLRSPPSSGSPAKILPAWSARLFQSLAYFHTFAIIIPYSCYFLSTSQLNI